MKNNILSYVLWVMVALFLSAPIAAQIGYKAAEEQEQAWQTGAMKGSGSAYSSQVTPVGSQTAYSTTTTTTDSSNSSGSVTPGGPRRSGNFGTPADTERDEDSPIGDAVLPMMIFLCIYCAIIAIRRNKYVKLLKR